jgi:hypothetical protein
MSRHSICTVLILALLCVFRSHSSGHYALAASMADRRCAPLPGPSGTVVHVASVSELENAVNNAVPDSTILVADGTYKLDGVYLRFDTPGLTLRSASGDREAVILDGNYITTEIVQIVASDVTIADLTLREAYYHPIHVMSSSAGDTLNTLIYNVHIIDPGEQAIKINPAAEGHYADDGLIACSHIELTDSGRPHIRNNCYTGGIDAHQARGWVIRDNLIEGFWCESGLSEHGIHMWRGCRDTLVERNLLHDNARGIGFGLVTSGEARVYPDGPCPTAEGGYVDHYGGIIRNNFVSTSRAELFASQVGFDCGICLWQACGAQVLHNTVASTQAPFSSIEWRFDNTDIDVANNLVTHNLMDRGGTARLSSNLAYQALTTFVDGAGEDLHLVSSATAAIDQGAGLATGLCDDDVDGDPRPMGVARDIGADEYGIAPPAAVTDLRVADADIGDTMTVALLWTPPTGALTTTLRYSSDPILELSWPTADFLVALRGDAEDFNANVPYDGGTVFFALKTQNDMGEWSALSNNAFWPRTNVWLPLLSR